MPGWFRKPPADPSPASRGPSCLSSPLLCGCSHFNYYNQTTLERNERPSIATTVGLASRGRVKGKVASTYWSRGLNSRVQLTRHYCPLLPLPTASPAHRRSSKGESTGSLHGASKAYYALEHLDDLFRPLLFSLRAAMHVKLLNVLHLLQLAQVALLIVYRFSSRCCTNIASSIMCCWPSSWSNCSTRSGSSGRSAGSLLPNRFCWLGFVQRILLVTAQIEQATGTEEL